jgi:hypothetical protein
MAYTLMLVMMTNWWKQICVATFTSFVTADLLPSVLWGKAKAHTLRKQNTPTSWL